MKMATFSTRRAAKLVDLSVGALSQYISAKKTPAPETIADGLAGIFDSTRLSRRLLLKQQIVCHFELTAAWLYRNPRAPLAARAAASAVGQRSQGPDTSGKLNSVVERSSSMEVDLHYVVG
jgi:hypothetical protein